MLLLMTTLPLVAVVSVSGILKGFDQLVNLVLDESKEALRGR